MHTSVRGIVKTKEGIVLIHRIKPQEDGTMREYYVLPGGKMEPGEDEMQTIQREMLEELGINVKPTKRVIEIDSKYDDSIQIVYMCEHMEGTIGTGQGPEFERLAKTEEVFEPVIVPLEEIKNINLVPEEIKDVLLENRCKRIYSYFIIKPDGIRYLEGIREKIEKKHKIFKSVKYYGIQDFEQIIKKLYYKHYAKKGDKFAKSFESYLYGLKDIFGNYGILVLVSAVNTDYETLAQAVFNTKVEIRQAYVNHNIGVITNYGDGEENFIRFISKTGENKSPRIMKDLGTHRLSDMNVIHCPDPNMHDTLKELEIILSQEGLIDDRNMISEEIMEKMIKYTTAKIQDDMRVPDYEGTIQPETSPFFRKQINEEIQELD